MLKKYVIVDRATNKITVAKRVSVNGQMAYDSPPELRKGGRLVLLSMDCGVITIVSALIGYFAASLRSVMLPCASVFAFISLLLGCIGTILERSAKKLGISGDISSKAKCKDIPWFDPYGLARDAVDVPGKKTYFVVDSERSAVVDVLHLGKWGQKWLNHLAKRQAAETTER